MQTTRRLVALALSLGGLAAGCDRIDSGPVELSYSLNEKAIQENEDLAGSRAGRAQLFGALELLFGSPRAPGYMRPESWIDDEYDPNYGSDELSEEHLDAIFAENEELFSRPPVSGPGLSLLGAIEVGRFDEARDRVPREALDLLDWWDELLAEWNDLRAAVQAGEEGAQAELDKWVADYKPELRDSAIHWYPTLRESAELYRIQCVHCHGVSGGGDGPTAEFLNPRPRDYRNGIFKFTALNEGARPRREDIYRVLDQGAYLTAMPSFRRFSEAQLQGLVDYVRLLSIRGETEILLTTEFDGDEGMPLEKVTETYLDVWAKWDESADYVIAYEDSIPVDRLAQRIAHGRELFMDAKSANCVSCHGATGRGDGLSAFKAREDLTDDDRARIEALDAEIAELQTEVEAEGDEHERQRLEWELGKREANRFELAMTRVVDSWGNPIQPRNLNDGVFRGGRRPIDLYRRIYAGINGTPMPSHSSMKDKDGNRLLSDEDLWDIVHYVRSLSSHDSSAGAGN